MSPTFRASSSLEALAHLEEVTKRMHCIAESLAGLWVGGVGVQGPPKVGH